MVICWKVAPVPSVETSQVYGLERGLARYVRDAYSWNTYPAPSPLTWCIVIVSVPSAATDGRPAAVAAVI